MKYFIDTEFIEGFHEPLFGKKRHFIDLISIGIVAEDGREYYAISKEYDYNRADKWVKENVIVPIYTQQPPSFKMQFCDVRNFHKYCGKSIWKIQQEIIDFINPHLKEHDYDYAKLENTEYTILHNTKCYNPDSSCPYYIWRNQPEFYGYYADYDWVLFCSLFGRMIDLPKGFPMYCKDLKQMLDESVSTLSNSDFFTKFHISKEMSLAEKLTEIKKHTQYPPQENEHSALADAKWNKKLYDFIQRLNP